MITIRKAVLNRIPADQIRAGLEDLARRPGTTPRLRELALLLAGDRDLRVSVITYEDGSSELEVLHAGPPHHPAQASGRRKFGEPDADAPGWVAALADESALGDTAELIREMLRDAIAS
jgi:hypothetical protein